VAEQQRFRALVEAGFRATTLRHALRHRLPPRRFKAVARELGFDAGAAARELDLHQWVALFEEASRLRGAVRSLR
jgi:hypothetical protein